MGMQFLNSENQAILKLKWDLRDIHMAFFKCVRWQVEETMDPISCPFHYFCQSVYPGNYPVLVDILVFVFTAASYLATIIIMVVSTSRRGRHDLVQSKRYLLPSGPVSLPVILLVLAKGQRINTVFPLSIAGPAILQLVHVSALAFENAADKNTNYAFFEASTISGILHASLYLDAVVLPYYTGFDALVTSRFSGECISCVCRKEALVAGGKLVSYRGRSVTTFLVVGSICMRIICRVSGEKGRGIIFCRFLLEGLAWIFMIKDCLYLTTSSPPEQTALRAATLGAILLLICLYLLIKTCSLLTNWFTWSTT
ncbi:uncharacterized protein LOC110814172 [Carica papaya]|uniref:uncharacterized protein LOC110814172 n=1 Tax=Carica papaya TaxID=3649 RepID=UPI000B8CD545|nr:uncharacterized protein LOC110814172 [Carica papaya]